MKKIYFVFERNYISEFEKKSWKGFSGRTYFLWWAFGFTDEKDNEFKPIKFIRRICEAIWFTLIDVDGKYKRSHKE